MQMPSISADADSKTSFCPQPCLPPPPCEGIVHTPSDVIESVEIKHSDKNIEIETINDEQGSEEAKPPVDKKKSLEKVKSKSNKKKEAARKDSATQYVTNPEVETAKDKEEAEDKKTEDVKKKQSSTQCPSLAEDHPPARGFKQPSWTQCPSVSAEIPPNACSRRARHSWTQCPTLCDSGMSNACPIRRSRSRKTAAACTYRPKSKVSCFKSPLIQPTCDFTPINACPKSACPRVKKLGTSGGDGYACPRRTSRACGNKCFRETKSKSKKCNNQDNSEADLGLSACERSCKMAQKNCEMPSTSCKAMESLTDVVHRAVMSIHSLRASLGETPCSDTYAMQQ